MIWTSKKLFFYLFTGASSLALLFAAGWYLAGMGREGGIEFASDSPSPNELAYVEDAITNGRISQAEIDRLDGAGISLEKILDGGITEEELEQLEEDLEQLTEAGVDVDIDEIIGELDEIIEEAEKKSKPTSTTSKTTLRNTTTTKKATTTVKRTTTTANSTTTANPTTTEAETTTTQAPTTQTTTSTNEGRLPLGKGPVNWTLTKSENFNSYDPALWENNFWGDFGVEYKKPVSDDEDACYGDSQVGVSNGNLEIKMRPVTATEDASDVCKLKGDIEGEYVSGYTSTRDRYQLTQGDYLEAKIFLPGSGSFIYNRPTFIANDAGKWPEGGSLRILQGIGGEACSVLVYTETVPGPVKESPSECNDSIEAGWIVVGMQWTYDSKFIITYNGSHHQTIDANSLTNGLSNNYELDISAFYALPKAPKNSRNTPAVDHTLKIEYIDVYRQ